MNRPSPTGTVYGYCRISLDRQESVSIESQEQSIRAYAAHRFTGSPVVILRDRGVSGGTRLLSRPEGQQLAKMKRGDHLVVMKVDRAFRSLIDGASHVDELTKRGIGLHFLDLQIATDTPVGRAMVHSILTFAQLERERIGERLREAAAYRRSQGQCMHCPHNPPMGWKVTGQGSRRKYIIDRADRRRCDALRALHDSGMGSRKLEQHVIAKQLKSRNGSVWSKTTIRRAIRASRRRIPDVERTLRGLGHQSPS